MTVTSTDTSTGGAAGTSTDTGATSTTTSTDTQAEIDKWKALSRKHEKEARDNASAAAELARIREDQKSDADKAADAATKAEARIAAMEARVLRRDVALEFKLTKDDAELLDNVTDETAMRSLAKRLADDAAGTSRKGNRVRTEGRTPAANGGSGDDEVRAFTKQLFARGDDD